MGCPSRLPNHPLTASQRANLAMLRRAGAISRETGRKPYGAKMAGFNPVVMGALRAKGLADSRTVRPKGGSQFTAYWLTPAGVERADQVLREESDA
jgi:hypothetical protein